MRLELTTREFVYARQNRLISRGYHRQHCEVRETHLRIA